MQLKTVPAKACQFAAELQVRANSDESKTAPITLVARSGEAVCHWYWGNVVHDLGGMTVAKPRIPLDYCHDDDEVIGYANKFDTSTGELVATGALIPYSPDPDDKATEIIYKAQEGVPYEASILFDGPLVVEVVSENATTFVNGEQMSGPITVIRQWTLRGIAVCPYGNDPNTSAAMKFSRGGDVPAQVISQEKHEMSATAEAEVKALHEEAAAVEAEATSDKPAEVVGEEGEETTTVEAETAGTRQIPVHQAPLDGVPHRVADVFPGGAEDRSHLLPGEPPGPARQKPLIGYGQPRLAGRPRNAFHHHATTWTVDTPQGIGPYHGDLPQRHELEAPGRQPIVAGSSLPAARADRPAIGPWFDRHFDGPPGAICPAWFSIHERLVTLDVIEDSLELHPESALALMKLGNSIVAARRSGCICFGTPRVSPARTTAPEHRERLAGVQGRQ